MRMRQIMVMGAVVAALGVGTGILAGGAEPDRLTVTRQGGSTKEEWI
jgi:hypothetical protein